MKILLFNEHIKSCPLRACYPLKDGFLEVKLLFLYN